MALDKTQSMLVEAIGSLLSGKTKLGLAFHKDHSQPDDGSELQFLHEHILDQFTLKSADLIHHDGICSAFKKNIDYRFIDHPKFHEGFRKDLQGMGIPTEEIAKAQDIVEELYKGLKKDSKVVSEKDAGWNPELAAIVELSKPIQIEEERKVGTTARVHVVLEDKYHLPLTVTYRKVLKEDQSTPLIIMIVIRDEDGNDVTDSLPPEMFASVRGQLEGTGHLTPENLAFPLEQ
jgi:hypothetical protein